jgi:hypothetical protein
LAYVFVGLGNGATSTRHDGPDGPNLGQGKHLCDGFLYLRKRADRRVPQRSRKTARTRRGRKARRDLPGLMAMFTRRANLRVQLRARLICQGQGREPGERAPTRRPRARDSGGDEDGENCPEERDQVKSREQTGSKHRGC